MPDSLSRPNNSSPIGLGGLSFLHDPCTPKGEGCYDFVVCYQLPGKKVESAERKEDSRNGLGLHCCRFLGWTACALWVLPPKKEGCFL